MTDAPLRVAGVPEAFNDPFESGAIRPPHEFIAHAGGSGQMLSALERGDIDVAFALTDCVVAAIEAGQPVRIACPVVRSPLTWAVAVAAGGNVQSTTQLGAATWGVSRRGSGSHVMVRVLAQREGWTAEPRFEVCGDFAGLRAAVTVGKVDAFLWELYTTRPFGEVRIVGEVPTPWGAFCAAVREDCKRVKEVHDVVDDFVEAGRAFLQNAGSVGKVADKYGMSEEDARSWMKGVRYAERGERCVPMDELEMTRRVLLEAGVIDQVRCSGVHDYHVKV